MLKLDAVAEREDCDIRVYKVLPLPIVVLQRWFNDQYRCFELFLETLSDRQRQGLFVDRKVFESAKDTYRGLWPSGRFENAAIRDAGGHRRLSHLVPSSRKRRGFFYWTTCVFREASAVVLEALMGNLRTVEEAHGNFKPWLYRSCKLIRGLNSADAARILARYGYLEPETRPLLARGALRGAAISLDGQSSSKSIDQLELEYGEEATCMALEMRAAEFIANSKDFFGRFQIEEGESWFYALHKTR